MGTSIDGDGSPPCVICAPELIPKRWEVVEIDGVMQDVPPRAGLDAAVLNFSTPLEKGELWISGRVFRERAALEERDFGLSDAKVFLQNQRLIPDDLEEYEEIVFAGTLLKDYAYGNRYVPCLRRNKSSREWELYFRWVADDFYKRHLLP